GKDHVVRPPPATGTHVSSTPRERPPTDHSLRFASRPRMAAMPSASIPTMATAKIAIATLASVDIGALRLGGPEVRVLARRQPDRQRAQHDADQHPEREERQPQ